MPYESARVPATRRLPQEDCLSSAFGEADVNRSFDSAAPISRRSSGAIHPDWDASNPMASISQQHEHPLEAALAYAARGWGVVPLHHPVGGACSCGNPGCSSPAKHPRTRHGLKDASTDPETIRRWWERWPNTNVGIVTGATSGLVVLDVDPRHGGDESMEALEKEHGALPTTPGSATGGGGRHILFAHPGGIVRSRAGIRVNDADANGLDTRGDGGYIVAPPSIHKSGQHYRWVMPLDHVPLAPLPAWLLDAVAGKARRVRKAVPVNEPIHEGRRNDTLFDMAAAWRATGDDEETILTRLRGVTCEPPLEDTELREIAKSAAKSPKSYHSSEYGNARRLIARHGRDLRYCKTWKTWVHWVGTHWSRDTTGEVERRAKDTIISLYGDAARIADSDDRKALVGHARRSEADARIRAMISIAESELDVAVKPEAFDSDPWLFNVENGTIDLKTGMLRRHRREDMLTRLAPVRFEPGATSIVWQKFLDRVVPDPETQAYLARAVGSSLTGITEDEQLYFVHGPTSTGKSTFAEAIKAMMGPYAVTADFNAFLRKRESGISNDIARLSGARLVVSLEVDEGKQLAAALIKSLTGGDTVAVRFLHHEFFEFRPQFKLWLVANHKPATESEDDAIWRRIRVIPFDHEIPEAERDESVKRILRGDAQVRSAILAWAVRGCLDWRQGGLRMPATVRKATDSYRQECDPLAEFLADGCVFEASAKVEVTKLFEAYERFCGENGDKALSKREVGRRLTKRGLKKAERSTGGRYVRHGIRLSEPSDPSEPPTDSFSQDTHIEEKTRDGSLTSLGSLGAEACDAAEERLAIQEADA